MPVPGPIPNTPSINQIKQGNELIPDRIRCGTGDLLADDTAGQAVEGVDFFCQACWGE
jgi:hypothetical protein